MGKQNNKLGDEMIKLSYKTLNSDSFNRALNKVATRNYRDFTTTYKVSKVVKGVREEIAAARKDFGKWSLEYFEHDANGNLVASPTPNDLTPYKIQEARQEEFSEKMEKFLNSEAEIEARPLRIQEIEEAALNAQEFLVLEPIFDQASIALLESPQPGLSS